METHSDKPFLVEEKPGNHVCITFSAFGTSSLLLLPKNWTLVFKNIKIKAAKGCGEFSEQGAILFIYHNALWGHRLNFLTSHWYSICLTWNTESELIEILRSVEMGWFNGDMVFKFRKKIISVPLFFCGNMQKVSYISKSAVLHVAWLNQKLSYFCCILQLFTLL